MKICITGKRQIKAETKFSAFVLLKSAMNVGAEPVINVTKQ